MPSPTSPFPKCWEPNEAVFLKAYEKHNKEVRKYFARRPHSLLEIDIPGGEGWPKLCGFLSVPLPIGAFPHINWRLGEGPLER